MEIKGEYANEGNLNLNRRQEQHLHVSLAFLRKKLLFQTFCKIKLGCLTSAQLRLSADIFPQIFFANAFLKSLVLFRKRPSQFLF